MPKRTLQIFTTTILVSVVSLSAFAGNSLAQKADTNKDGLIQLSEFTAVGNQRFSEMDADANGLVSWDERKAYRQQKRETRAQKKFAKTDSNGDGFISKAEYRSARGAIQQRRQNIDINGDGAIDLAEHRVATITRFESMDKNGDSVLNSSEQSTAAR